MRPIGTTKNGIKYLDESQLLRFKNAVRNGKNFQHELWFDLCLYFGLRVTELTHLKVENIKEDIQGIEISGVKNGLTMTYPRIDAKLWKKLQRWLKIRSARLGERSGAYIFSSPSYPTLPISEQAVKSAFKNYLSDAGIDNGFSVHSLRHTCGVLKARAGENPIEIKDWLRQRSLDSTLEYLRLIKFENQSERASQIFSVYL